VPLLQGVGCFGGVVAVEADGRLGAVGQFGVAVEEDQLVTGMGVSSPAVAD
jgi:hypothetical protein